MHYNYFYPLPCANSDNKSRGQFKEHGTNQHHQYLLFYVLTTFYC